MRLNVYNVYTEKYETIEISVFKLIKVLFGFPQKIGKRQYEKWTAPIDFYLFYCKYGFEIDYPHGYDSHLHCEEPKPFLDIVKKIDRNLAEKVFGSLPVDDKTLRKIMDEIDDEFGLY